MKLLQLLGMLRFFHRGNSLRVRLMVQEGNDRALLLFGQSLNFLDDLDGVQNCKYGDI